MRGFVCKRMGFVCAGDTVRRFTVDVNIGLS